MAGSHEVEISRTSNNRRREGGGRVSPPRQGRCSCNGRRAQPPHPPASAPPAAAGPCTIRPVGQALLRERKSARVRRTDGDWRNAVAPHASGPQPYARPRRDLGDLSRGLTRGGYGRTSATALPFSRSDAQSSGTLQVVGACSKTAGVALDPARIVRAWPTKRETRLPWAMGRLAVSRNTRTRAQSSALQGQRGNKMTCAKKTKMVKFKTKSFLKVGKRRHLHGLQCLEG